MELYSKLNFEFTEIFTEHIHLTKEEWKMMIMVFCLELADKPTSKIMIDKLVEFINGGNSIKIANYDTKLQSSYIYPKIRYDSPKSALIIIPSVPYFVDVEVISKHSDTIPDDQDLLRVSQYCPSSSKLESSSKYKDNKNQIDWIKKERMPQIIGFAHELVHCLRHFEAYETNQSNEEEHTIYGIGSKTLKYNIGGKSFYITENTIRRDFGFKPRMSHNSREVYCYRLTSTYSESYKFTKQDFFN